MSFPHKRSSFQRSLNKNITNQYLNLSSNAPITAHNEERALFGLHGYCLFVQKQLVLLFSLKNKIDLKRDQNQVCKLFF